MFTYLVFMLVAWNGKVTTNTIRGTYDGNIRSDEANLIHIPDDVMGERSNISVSDINTSSIIEVTNSTLSSNEATVTSSTEMKASVTSSKHTEPIITTSTDSKISSKGVDTTTSASNSTKEPRCNITTTILKSHGVVQSVNYPNPYYTNCEWTYYIDVGTGYNIHIRIEALDIDRDAGDKLTIEPACSTNHSNSKYVNGHMEEFITDFSCSKAIIRFIAEYHMNNHTGFSLLYDRYSSSDLTTASQFVTHVPGWLQLYLQGITANQFMSKKDYFKLSIAKAAKVFCKDNNIDIAGITLEDAIILNSILECPSTWPWSSKCVQVNLSIILNADELDNDQLTTIKNMNLFTEEISELGISEYEIPDITTIMWFWISLIASLSIIFLLILLIIIKTKLIRYYFQRLLNSSENNKQDFLKYQRKLASQMFTAQNENKFRFLSSYEKIPSQWVQQKVTDNLESNLHNNRPISMISEEIDDFDSDEDPVQSNAPYLGPSSFSKANTCYHMYAEPHFNNGFRNSAYNESVFSEFADKKNQNTCQYCDKSNQRTDETS